jgi:chromosome condensin MukBEF ATPase and DNA-binding subunit MukB
MSSLFHLSAKEIHSCLRYVAELRVQGKEWEEISQDLQRPMNEVRRFVHQHEEVFRLCMKRAHQDQKQLCYSVAYEVLRHQTASKNEKISHSSACMLLRMKLSDDRIRLKKLQEKMRALAQQNKKTATPDPLIKVPQLGELKTPPPDADQVITPRPSESEMKVEIPVTILPGGEAIVRA